MFETFQVKKFYVGNSGLMALYSYGRRTGLVCDSGDNVTSVTAIFEGYSVSEAMKRNFGGRDLTTYMQKLLADAGQE